MKHDVKSSMTGSNRMRTKQIICNQSLTHHTHIHTPIHTNPHTPHNIQHSHIVVLVAHPCLCCFVVVVIVVVVVVEGLLGVFMEDRALAGQAVMTGVVAVLLHRLHTYIKDGFHSILNIMIMLLL